MMVRNATAYRAAWVPDDDPERPWDEASELAVAWTDGEADRLGRPSVLVTNTKGHQAESGPLASFVGRSLHTTPRSRSVSIGAGPVLAYVPYGRELAYAVSLARATSLCVVETVSFPVRGWAAAVAAINLLTGEPTPPPDAEVKEELDHLVFNGNNGYGDQYGKRDALSILRGLAGRPDYDAAFIVGYLAGHGISDNGLANIARIIAKVR